MARLVKISQEELDSVRKLYESVMSYACHGLFFREGMVLADEIVKGLPANQDPLAVGRQMILDREAFPCRQFAVNVLGQPVRPGVSLATAFHARILSVHGRHPPAARPAAPAVRCFLKIIRARCNCPFDVPTVMPASAAIS